MTVLLVLLTFLVFIAIDALLSRKKAKAPVVAQAAPAGAALAPDHVLGFHLPADLHYHPGHSWVMRERQNVVRVGVDEFGAALLGKLEGLELPKPGRWVRQGQKAFSFFRRGERTEMVSPIEGEVVEVNSSVLQDPSVIRKDPYGNGWLMRIFVPDEENTTRNLLPQELVKSWMAEAVNRLYALQPQLAGAVAADGGRPIDDLAEAMPNVSWPDLTAEFFLTR